jgi:hypothetical protein
VHRLLLSLVFTLPVFLILGVGCANNDELGERVQALEAKQEVTNKVVEGSHDTLAGMQTQVSALESQAVTSGDIIGQISDQLEDLSDDLSELTSRTISGGDAVEELAADMEKAISELRSLGFAGNLSSRSLPVFNLDISEDEANQLFNDCLVGRVQGLMGSMGSLFGKAFADEFPVEDLTGFSAGALSSVDEIAFMGAFFGCWTIGALPSFDTDLAENEAEQFIYDCLWSRMYGWGEKTSEEWEFIDVEIIERLLQPVPEINTSLLSRMETISIWGALLGCWSIDDQ